MRAKVGRGRGVAMALAAAIGAAGCAGGEPDRPPRLVNGMERYDDNRVAGSVPCGALPVVVATTRSVMELTGACRHVIVEGRRNDVTVDIAPGGLIEITGEHNDVTWRQVGEGRRPELRIVGASNAFHRG